MAELDCKICFNKMDKETHLPKMLFCGHTFCTECLTIIFESSTKFCPSCRKQIFGKKVVDYPVNYMILDIINNAKASLDGKLNQYRDQLHKLKEEFEIMKPTIKSIHDKYELAMKSVAQLNTLLESEDDFDEEKSEDEIKELVGILEGFRSCKISSDLPLTSQVSLQCKDFEDVSLLLHEILTGMMNKQKKFAALLRIDGVKKFARLSFSDRYFCIHAFEILEERHNKFITICFQDLLKALLESYSICAFFELYYRRGCSPCKVMVQVSGSTSFLGSQFLKLCTGELGKSYKGQEYSQDYSGVDKQYIIQLKNFGWKLDDHLDDYAKYFLCKGNEDFSLTTNTCYLSCQNDGSFEIFRHIPVNSTSRNFSNVIGPVVDFKGDFRSKFQNATLRNIFDCGIAFKVSLFPLNCIIL